MSYRFETLLNDAVSTVRGNRTVQFVKNGYGQVEPNHLSAQRTGQIYAQLPAAADIPVLEQGQFVKYNYAKGVCDFGCESTDPIEWMLVFNEIKLYREGQSDCEFAMVKNHYNARVYSPYGEDKPGFQSRYYNGKDADGNAVVNLYKITKDTAADGTKTYYTKENDTYTAATLTNGFEEGETYYELYKTYNYDKVTTEPDDLYELFQTDDPFHVTRGYKEKMMEPGTKMVPRVFKTNVGDIFTTNTIDEEATDLTVGAILMPRTTDGILVLASSDNADTTGGMKWQVVKVYTMPDGQPGVKIMRIA